MYYTKVINRKLLLIALEFYVYNTGVYLDSPLLSLSFKLMKCQFTHYSLPFEASIHLDSSSGGMNIGVILSPGMNGLAREHVDRGPRDRNASLSFKGTYRNTIPLA